MAIGCGFSTEQVGNGEACEQNSDCESDLCVSGVCQPKPVDTGADAGTASASVDAAPAAVDAAASTTDSVVAVDVPGVIFKRCPAGAVEAQACSDGNPATLSDRCVKVPATGELFCIPQGVTGTYPASARTECWDFDPTPFGDEIAGTCHYYQGCWSPPRWSYPQGTGILVTDEANHKCSCGHEPVGACCMWIPGDYMTDGRPNCLSPVFSPFNPLRQQ